MIAEELAVQDRASNANQLNNIAPSISKRREKQDRPIFIVNLLRLSTRQLGRLFKSFSEMYPFFYEAVEFRIRLALQ